MSENRGNGVAQPDVAKGAPVADVLDEVLSTPVGAHEKRAPVRLYRLLRQYTGMALFYVVAIVVFFLVTQPADLGVTTIAGRWAGIGIAIAGLGALVVFPWLRPKKVGGDDSPNPTLPSSPDTLHTGRTRNDLLIENYHAMTVRHAQSSFRNSQVAMAVGLIVLGAGVIVVMRSPEWTRQLVVGGLAAIGSTFSGYLGRTFIRSHEKALDQVNYLFSQPLVSHYLEYSRKVAKELGSERLRDKALDRVVDRALESATASVPTSAATSKNRKGESVDPGDGLPVTG
jgi:hypothetical protein